MTNPEQVMEPGYGHGAFDVRINRDDAAPNRSRRKYTIPPEQDGSIPMTQDTITVDTPNAHARGGGEVLWSTPTDYYPSTLNEIPDDDMPLGYPGA